MTSPNPNESRRELDDLAERIKRHPYARDPMHIRSEVKVPIIGFGHYSRVGKDTVANYLVEQARTKGILAKKISFAWKLKDISHQLYAWTGLREAEYYETDEGAELRNIVLPGINMTPVELWIAIGTPALRDNVYDGTWVDYLLKTDHKCDLLVIPDVRFLNEVDAIRERGGKLIKLCRPGFGPRPTSVADQALVGYTGWDQTITATNMDELSDHATRILQDIVLQ